MLIDGQDLKWVRMKQSLEEATATKNIYIMLWKSFACQIKTAMQTAADKNETDGPALLFHLLSQYTGPAELVIKTYQQSLNNLPERLKELGFAINKFCNYMSEKLKTLCGVGSNDKQASLKLYKVLVSTRVGAFSFEIRACKAAVATKNKVLDFFKLMTIACTKYTSLVMCSQWPSSHKSSTDNTVALKSELKQKEKIIKYFKS
eukprot:12293936-Ditylum_brightwellii.AAC.1